MIVRGKGSSVPWQGPSRTGTAEGKPLPSDEIGCEASCQISRLGFPGDVATVPAGGVNGDANAAFPLGAREVRRNVSRLGVTLEEFPEPSCGHHYYACHKRWACQDSNLDTVGLTPHSDGGLCGLSVKMTRERRVNARAGPVLHQAQNRSHGEV